MCGIPSFNYLGIHTKSFKKVKQEVCILAVVFFSYKSTNVDCNYRTTSRRYLWSVQSMRQQCSPNPLKGKCSAILGSSHGDLIFNHQILR